MLKPSRNCLTRVSSGLITLLPFCRTVRSIFTGGWNGLRSDARRLGEGPYGWNFGNGSMVPFGPGANLVHGGLQIGESEPPPHPVRLASSRLLESGGLSFLQPLSL